MKALKASLKPFETVEASMKEEIGLTINMIVINSF